MSYEKQLLEKLNTFIQASKNITSNKSLKEFIQNIIEDVIRAIEKADGGFLILWDDNEQLLKIKAAVNFKEEMYLQNTLLPGEGISGTVFSTGKSMLINGEEAIQQAMANMRNQTFQYYLKSTIHNAIPKSCMSVPITHQQKKIGILTIDNFLNEGYFTEEDVTFLEAIGSQIAISIVTANSFREKERRAEELETILTFHNQLNKAALKSNGLKSLVEKLGSILQGSIFFFDPLLRLDFAHGRSTQNILECQQWLQRNSDALIASQLITQIPLEEQKYSYALSVQSSFGSIGYLVINEMTSAIDITKELTIKHAASLIAMEQMKYQEHLRFEQEEKGHLLKELLQNNLTAEVLYLLKKYNMLHLHYYCFVAIHIETISPSDTYQTLAQEQAIRQAFSKDFHVISFPHAEAFYVLLGAKELQSEDRVTFIQSAANRFSSQFPEATISIGRPVTSLQHVTISYKDAELLAFEVNSQSAKDTVHTFKSLGYKRYLLSIDEEDQHYFVTEILGPILPLSDTSDKNELLLTLHTYLQCQKNVAQTAESLHLHQNSVYYRLQQLQNKLQCDFDNLHDVTNLQTALYLYNKLEKRNSTN